MTIVAAQSVSNFFDGIVTDAMRSQGVHATQGATRYLVAPPRRLCTPRRPCR